MVETKFISRVEDKKYRDVRFLQMLTAGCLGWTLSQLLLYVVKSQCMQFTEHLLVHCQLFIALNGAYSELQNKEQHL